MVFHLLHDQNVSLEKSCWSFVQVVREVDWKFENMKRRSSAAITQERCVSPTIKRTKVQAQRKFAQGSYNYTYSAPKIVAKTPECVFPSFQSTQQSSLENEECELNNFSSLPTVDDFLTFLCFRETDVLPERLNYLNSPQFDVLPAKKKYSKSNSNNEVPPNKTSVIQNRESKTAKTKSKSNLKKEKQLAECKLRSHNLSGTKLVGKNLSCPLALKHNQRLRSKNISESKLHTLKSKSQLTNKLTTSVNKLVTGSLKNHNPNGPLTRASSRNEFDKNVKPDDTLARVTRRNSTLQKLSDTESVVERPKETQSKKTVPAKVSSDDIMKDISIRLEDSGYMLKKPSSRSLPRPIPKTKTALTNSPAPLKPVKRGTRCSNVKIELTSNRSTRSNNLQLDEPCGKNTRSLNVLPDDVLPSRSTRSNSVQLDDKIPTPDNLNRDDVSSYRSTRPSRKTKEAAALYMEMLGRELLSAEMGFDDDDDDMSVESFPELPNAEQHMRREKELKELHLKKSLEKPPPPPPRKSSTPKSKTFPKPTVNCAPAKLLKESTASTQVDKKSRKKNSSLDLDSATKKMVEHSGPERKPPKRNASPTLSDTKEMSKASGCDKKPAKKIAVANKSENESNSICKTSKKNASPTRAIMEKKKGVKTDSDDELIKKESEKKLKKNVSDIDPERGHKGWPKDTELEKKSSKKSALNCTLENKILQQMTEKEKLKKTQSEKRVLKMSSSPSRIDVNIKDLPNTEKAEKKTSKKNAVLSTVEMVKDLTKDASTDTGDATRKDPTTNVVPEKMPETNTDLLVNETVEKETQSPVTLEWSTNEDAEENEFLRKSTSPMNTDALACKNLDSEKKIFKKNGSFSSPPEVNRKSEAFSADNENSVYAFEPDLPTTSPPFRRLKPPTPSKPTVSNSIAVQVNFGNDVKVECSSTGETQVSSTTDSGDRVFYIPIPTSTVSSTLGVALKLGTDGPNQKIIIGATLITNSPTFTTNTVTTSVQDRVFAKRCNNVRKLSSASTAGRLDGEMSSSGDETFSIAGRHASQTNTLTRKMSSISSSRIFPTNTTASLSSKTSTVDSTCKKGVVKLASEEQSLKKSNLRFPVEKVVSFTDNRDEHSACSSSSSLPKVKRTTSTTAKSSIQSLRCLKMNKKKKVESSDTLSDIDDPEAERSKAKSQEPALVNGKEKPQFVQNRNVKRNTDRRRSSPIFFEDSSDSLSSCSSSEDLSTYSESTSEEDITAKNKKTSSVAVTSSHTLSGTIKVPVTPTKTHTKAVQNSSNKLSNNEPKTTTRRRNSFILSEKNNRSVSAEKAVSSTYNQQSEPIPSTSTSSVSKKVVKNAPAKKSSVPQSVKILKINNRLKNESPSQPVVIAEPVKIDSKVKKIKPETVKMKSEVKPKCRLNKIKNVKKPESDTEVDEKKVISSVTGEILEAPTFHPTQVEFSDPLEYIETIRPIAEKFGLCRIVPPSNFRPDCKVNDGMRFTAYNQYIHKMLNRWGPNVKEMMAIKKFLATQNIQLTQAPRIGGMEIDLPRLYQIVQQCGGLSAVIENERWFMVADIMKIPKLAQDRITKLDDIYCKYLLPYDILSHEERERLFEEIEKEWSTHLENPSEEEIFEDIDECITKGRTMALSCFYRTARNTMMMCTANTDNQQGPSIETIEEEFWNLVSERKSHICVHCGSVDSGTEGYGFSMSKNSAFRKHPWNLKVLTNNAASILRFLGPIMGVTVPTLHFGMLYSACCWYRDPHGFPWVEYLHTGANKIWYGIPDGHSNQFRTAMKSLVPRYCREKKIWLPSDTVMIPPPLLTANGVSLSRVVQEPGQFIVVFPKAFTSSISTGYLVSEIVYFAYASWLDSAKQIFEDMQESGEPPVFSLEQLLMCIGEDARPSLPLLNKILPLLIDLRDTETTLRKLLKEQGVNTIEKLNVSKKRKSKSTFQEDDYYECDTCHANLHVSMVENSLEQCNYCLKHASSILEQNSVLAKDFKLLYMYTVEALDDLIEKVKAKIETKNLKKSHK